MLQVPKSPRLQPQKHEIVKPLVTRPSQYDSWLIAFVSGFRVQEAGASGFRAKPQLPQQGPTSGYGVLIQMSWGWGYPNPLMIHICGKAWFSLCPVVTIAFTLGSRHLHPMRFGSKGFLHTLESLYHPKFLPNPESYIRS